VFFRLPLPVETQRTGGKRGRWLRPKTSLAILVDETSIFLQIGHPISPTSQQIATAPPRRSFPRRNTFFFHQIAALLHMQEGLHWYGWFFLT
jgi:hypothetical protein